MAWTLLALSGLDNAQSPLEHSLNTYGFVRNLNLVWTPMAWTHFGTPWTPLAGTLLGRYSTVRQLAIVYVFNVQSDRIVCGVLDGNLAVIAILL